MKKFFLIFAAVVLTAFSAKTFAQSTGINPMIDSTHVYTVANNSESTYAWTLEALADGGGTDLFGGAVTDVAEITAGGTSNSITVKWKNPDIGATYFLHVTETSSVATGECTNRKVLAIEPVNNFRIYVYNVNSTGTLMTDTDSLAYGICAPAIANTIEWNGTNPVTTLNANDFTYAYDSLYFYYKVVAEGINFATTSWTPSLTIAQANGTFADITIDSIIGGTISGASVWNVTAWTTDTEQTPTIPAGAGNNVLWVRVKVDNNTGTPSTANENTTANDYTFNLSLGSGGSSIDEDGNKTTNTQGTAPKQTQKARPATGNISFN